MADNGTIIALISLALALVIGVAGAIRYVNSEITQERNWREEADESQREKLLQMSRELAEYKLEATEKYAPYAAIEKLEERLVIGLDKLGARQETMIGRIEALSAELMRRRPISRET